jgi:hypothetical protein
MDDDRSPDEAVEHHPDDGAGADRPPATGDDRDADHVAGARDARGRRAVRLLQGYVWHPRDAAIDLADHLPATLGDDVHVLWDAMPAAPFTFFDDGTLSATQRVYQLTVLRFVEVGEDPATLLAWVAETLQRALEGTPPSVGWQLLDDLRDVF